MGLMVVNVTCDFPFLEFLFAYTPLKIKGPFSKNYFFDLRGPQNAYYQQK